MFVCYTFKNYYSKLVWPWKLFTAYFLCPPGWNLGTLWLDSSKYLIICLTLNTCLHPIWVKVKPVLKCFAGSNIPHLVRSHILQDRALSDTKLKESNFFFYFARIQMPFALIVQCFYHVPAYVWNTNDELIKNPFLPHAKRGGWVMLQHKIEGPAKAGGIAVQGKGTLATSLTP